MLDINVKYELDLRIRNSDRDCVAPNRNEESDVSRQTEKSVFRRTDAGC